VCHDGPERTRVRAEVAGWSDELGTGLIEIRDYHYRKDRMDEYRAWAKRAARYFGHRWELLGWWLDAGHESRLSGSDPMELAHGLANVTWMIRWDSLEQREAAWNELWNDEEWERLWDQHPGPEGYHQMAVRFLEEP
jgi:hypothetical protein